MRSASTLALACALLAGARALESSDLRSRAADQSREARSAAERYARITAAFPVTETTTENLRVAVVEFRAIAERSAQPEAAFVHVSRVLEQFPQMEIDGVKWSVGRPGGEREGAERAPAAAQGVQVEISGRVNATQRNDYRGITAQVQAFASALNSRQAAWEAQRKARAELFGVLTPEQLARVGGGPGHGGRPHR